MTSPDVVVGAGMVAVGVAAYAVNRLALAMQANTAAVEQDIDDLAAVAAAVGVYIEGLPREGKQGQPTTRSSAPRANQTSGTTGRAPVAGPSTRRENPSAGRETRPEPADGPAVDHDRCDDCGRTICQCNPGPEPALCPGAVEQGCRHGRSLCLTCMAACPECLADLRSQGVLSQHGRNAGWWTR